MRHTDREVKGALEILNFKYIGRDEDGTITAFREWPNWDEKEEAWYACGRTFQLDEKQFQAVCKGYSMALAGLEFNEEGEAYDI